LLFVTVFFLLVFLVSCSSVVVCGCSSLLIVH